MWLRNEILCFEDNNLVNFDSKVDSKVNEVKL